MSAGGDDALAVAKAQGSQDIATLKSRAARAGFQLVVIDNHGVAVYCLQMFGRFVEHRNLLGVAGFLDRIGAAL